MQFIRFNSQIAMIVKTGPELTAENPGSDLDDHLGLWFGETEETGQPIVHTIPAEYVNDAEKVEPIFRH